MNCFLRVLSERITNFRGLEHYIDTLEKKCLCGWVLSHVAEGTLLRNYIEKPHQFMHRVTGQFDKTFKVLDLNLS